MIRFDHVTFTYAEAPEPALRDVDLHIPGGELWLVIGETGSGKSTLLQAINGLVPHFTGGELLGSVEVDGLATSTHPPRELADVVGMVGQDPDGGLRHRRRRGRAGVHDGEPGRRARRDATPRRGRARPPRPAPAPHPRRSRTLSSGAEAARGDRFGAHRLAAGAGARRAHLGARPRCRRGGPGHAHPPGRTTSASPWSPAEHRLERVLQYADRVAVVEGGRVVGRVARRGDGGCLGGAAGRGARPGRGLEPPAALGARRPPAGRRAPLPAARRAGRPAAPRCRRRPRRRAAARRRRGVGHPPGCPLRRRSSRSATCRSTCAPARCWRSWAATGRASPRCWRHLAGLREPTDGKVTIDGQAPAPAQGQGPRAARRARSGRSRHAPLRGDDRRRVPRRRPRQRARAGHHPGRRRAHRARARPGGAPARRVRGPAAGRGPRRGAGARAAAGAPRRAHPRPRLRGQGPPRRDPAGAGARRGMPW